LLPYIASFLQEHRVAPALFVEPFAGGAGVALQLLADGVVDSIGLSDVDPLVSAFWETLFCDVEWLIRQVETVEVTVGKWKWFTDYRPTSRRGRALKFLFLNRTSFSGIVGCRSGPIGGRDQTSENKIDCRFPRKRLIRRIRQAHALKDKVAFVWGLDWHQALRRIQRMQAAGRLAGDIFLYLDPPFFRKAEELYTHHFVAADHRRLRDSLIRLQIPWLLSYDAGAEATTLYGDRDLRLTLDHVYTVSKADHRHPVQEILITNLPRLRRVRPSLLVGKGNFLA
jgi:DNA adenine methylase